MKNKTLRRCPWAETGGKLYQTYHDEEWGIPVHDDRKHFEFLILEGAQAGLSWLTILKRREGYRRAFDGFDPEKVARYDEKKIASLIACDEIIRNKLKIRSCVRNAQLFLEIQKEFGSFDKYIWGFVKGKTIQNKWKSLREVPQETKEAKALSADLKKRGFKFVGPAIMYAYMQATGMVNDHITGCFCHGKTKPKKKVRWELYIIRAESGMLYTGITTDLERRFAAHKQSKKGARFFRFSSPEAVLYREPHPNRSEASKRESQIKKMTREEKEHLINSQPNSST